MPVQTWDGRWGAEGGESGGVGIFRQLGRRTGYDGSDKGGRSGSAAEVTVCLEKAHSEKRGNLEKSHSIAGARSRGNGNGQKNTRSVFSDDGTGGGGWAGGRR